MIYRMNSSVFFLKTEKMHDTSLLACFNGEKGWIILFIKVTILQFYSITAIIPHLFDPIIISLVI